MSSQEIPEKIRIVEEREPREPRFRLDLDFLVLPGIILGGLIVAAVYKDDIVDIISKVADLIPGLIPKPENGDGDTNGNGNGNGKEPTPKPTPSPAAGVDKNGITKIYPTAGGKETYNAANSDNPGRKEWEINTKGYLNMECTGYIKAGGDQIAIKMRGGHHNDSCPKCGCCVEVRFHVTGSGDNFATECPHPDYNFKKIATKFSYGDIKNKWVGVKGIVFNSGSQIKVQAWMDTGGLDSAGKPANKWKLWFETTVSDSKFQKNPVNGPDALVYFRIDNTNTTAKYLSVREINAASANPAYSYSSYQTFERITIA